MTIENDFLQFANAGGANVISQSVYASLATLGSGFETGEAYSNQVNKVWRQSATTAYVLMQLMCDVTGLNAVDDGTSGTLLTNLNTMLTLAGFGIDVGSANTYQVNLSPAVSIASSAVQNGTLVRFRPLNANNGASTLSVNGASAVAIVDSFGKALIGGEITINAEVVVSWNSSANHWVMLANQGGDGSKPRVFVTINGSASILHQSGDRTVSVGHPGTGTFSITFGTAMPDANYTVVATALSSGAAVVATVNTQSTSGFQVFLYEPATSSAVDTQVNIAVYR